METFVRFAIEAHGQEAFGSFSPLAARGAHLLSG